MSARPFAALARAGEAVAEAARRVAITSGDQIALRTVVAAAGAGAWALCRAWTSHPIATAVGAAALVCLAVAVVVPAGAASTAFLGAIGLSWWIGGSAGPLWHAGVLALLAGAVHAAATACARGSAHAPFTAAARRATWRGIGGLLAASGGLILIVAAVAASPVVPRGIVWTVSGLVITVALAGAGAALVRGGGGR